MGLPLQAISGLRHGRIDAHSPGILLVPLSEPFCFAVAQIEDDKIF